MLIATTAVTHSVVSSSTSSYNSSGTNKQMQICCFCQEILLKYKCYYAVVSMQYNLIQSRQTSTKDIDGMRTLTNLAFPKIIQGKKDSDHPKKQRYHYFVTDKKTIIFEFVASFVFWVIKSWLLFRKAFFCSRLYLHFLSMLS